MKANTIRLVKPPAEPQWKAPRYLAPATRRWFSDVVKEYVCEEHHVRLLAAAGSAWDRMEAARVILDREGLTFTDRFHCPKARPEIAIERDSRLAFARLLRELALDVSAPDNARPPTLGAGRRRA